MSTDETINPICESKVLHGELELEEEPMQSISGPLSALQELAQTKKALADISLYVCALLAIGHGGYVALSPKAVEQLQQDYNAQLLVGEHEPTKSIVLQAKLTPKVSRPPERPKIYVDPRFVDKVDSES